MNMALSYLEMKRDYATAYEQYFKKTAGG